MQKPAKQYHQSIVLKAFKNKTILVKYLGNLGENNFSFFIILKIGRNDKNLWHI